MSQRSFSRVKAIDAAEDAYPFPRELGIDTAAEPRRVAPRLRLSMSGYNPLNPALYRTWNLGLAVLLIAFCLPLIALIAVMLAATQGPRNIFYRGERIGRGERTFHILKFKTLRDEAAKATQDKVLPANSRLETPVGRYLRETRLDELPQLFNVLAGDMNMLGPRPVRRAIADQCRGVVPGYEARFSVKPGLIGYTQALMPHGASKAIRARVNGLLVRRPVAIGQEILFIALTGLSVLRWTAKVAGRAVSDLVRGRPEGWLADAEECDGEAVVAGHDAHLRLVAISADRLQVESDRPLAFGAETVAMALKSSGRPRTSRCSARLLESRIVGGRVAYSFSYEPTSALNRYLIDRYLQRKVVVI